MYAYQQILLTTDFSKFSQYVAQKAISLAGHFNAKITLLHVIEKHLNHEIQEPISTVSTQLSDTSQTSSLQDFIQSIENFNPVPIEVLVDESAEEEISNVAREIKADLIIISANGDNQNSLSPTFDVDAIKKKVSCDVLVVHAEAD